MTTQHNLKPKPKAGLHQAVRNIADCRVLLSLSLQAVEYLRYAAERVSPDDVQNARIPWCYERVDDLAHALHCEPRTIHRIEKMLIERGLIKKDVLANGHRHAKRCRQTGALLWAHGISLAPILERRDELAALATNRADIEREYRAARQGVNNLRARLKDALASAEDYPAMSELRSQMWAIYDAAPARIIRTIHDLPTLTRVQAKLTLAVDTLIEALDALDTPSPASVDNHLNAVNMSDQSDTGVRHKYLTTPSKLYSCRDAEPSKDDEIANFGDPAHAVSSIEMKDAGGHFGDNPENRPTVKNQTPAITAKHLIQLAPKRWSENLGDPDQINWQLVGFVADARRAELGVSESAWRSGVARMGPRSAAICLAVLDANRDHPTKPVRSVGGAFVAMTRRAEAGKLNLEPSINWIAARRAGAAKPTTGRANA